MKQGNIYRFELKGICGNLKMKWKDFDKHMEIEVPKDFSFEQCMVYLGRSNEEVLHRIEDGELYKLLKLEGTIVLVKISELHERLKVTFMGDPLTKRVRAQVAKYVWDMFDLGIDLTSFYELAERDPIIKILVDKYKGLRIIKIEDMFEALSWAIIGQQINLKFAYTLKKRLVELYGENMIFEDMKYFLFPTPQRISTLEVDDLKQLQFTTRKAEYIIGVAKLLNEGVVKRNELSQENNYEDIKKALLQIRGVGNWTADYTIMKCFNIRDALPIADVGLHNALKGILELEKKPTIEEIEKLATNWKGWQAYTTFYLWRW
ncbi:MAG: DNA-3-methyladenine glycosylase family protein [Alkaliphilus sp.]